MVAGIVAIAGFAPPHFRAALSAWPATRRFRIRQRRCRSSPRRAHRVLRAWALVRAISGHRAIATRARSLTNRCGEVVSRHESHRHPRRCGPLQCSGLRSRKTAAVGTSTGGTATTSASGAIVAQRRNPLADSAHARTARDRERTARRRRSSPPPARAVRVRRCGTARPSCATPRRHRSNRRPVRRPRESTCEIDQHFGGRSRIPP